MHRSSCSCDHHYQPNSFSMLFTMPPYHQHICPYASSSSSSSSVDCTLSLATPAASTRLTTADDDYDSPESRHSSRFCWDFLHPDNNTHSTAPLPSHKSNRGGATNSSAADSLLARRCANCDTTSTPLWRNGPRGPKSLCNACGIRFKKEERRAAATTAVTVVGSGGDGREGYNQNGWMHNNKTASSWYSPAAVGSEYSRYRDEVDDRDSTFLSWRLNVTDRPGLVHDFTRY